MTIFQSDWGKGLQTPPRPQSAGAVHVAKFKYTAISTLANTDIIEIGVLPAFASISDAILVTEGVWTGITGDIGIMSGVVGDELSARTSGNELFAAVDLTAAQSRLAGGAGLLVAPAPIDRSIGIKVSGAVTGASTKKLTLVLFYAQ